MSWEKECEREEIKRYGSLCNSRRLCHEIWARVCVSIDSSVGSSVFENVSVVYNGASRHMNWVYDFFKMITTLGSGHFI